MSLVGAVGSIAVILSIAFAWPQAITARRASDVSGISLTTTVLVVLTATTWTLYGLARDDLTVIVGNGAALAAALVTWTTVHRRGGDPDAPIRSVLAGWLVAIVMAATVGVLAGWGPAPVGALGAALGISMSVPQAVATARRGGTAGVSLATYVMLFAVMAAWLGYGVLTRDPVIWATNVVGLVVVGTVITVLVRRPPERGAREPDVGVMLEGASD